jgi:hypothetical protein
MFNDDWVIEVDWQPFHFEPDLRVGMFDDPDCVVIIVGSYANFLPARDLGAPRR